MAYKKRVVAFKSDYDKIKEQIISKLPSFRVNREKGRISDITNFRKVSEQFNSIFDHIFNC